MSNTQRSAATGAEAAAALAEIQRQQRRVVLAVLVPGWYWWVIAAGMIAIGAARDTKDLVVQAVTIPLAALAMAGLTAAMIPAIRRRIQVNSATLPGARGAAAIFGLIVLVDGVTIGITATLAAARYSHPDTVGAAAGAAMVVIAGPVVNRYLRRLMLGHSEQHLNAAPETGGNSA